MSTTVKVLIIVVVCGAILALGLVGAGFYWWSAHKDEYLEAGKNAVEEGAAYGQNVDNRACVESALARYKRDPGFGASIKAGLYMRGCLEKSRPTPGFCDAVPPETEIMKSARWRVAQCQQAGLNDSYCQQIVGQVQQYCHSEKE